MYISDGTSLTPMIVCKSALEGTSPDIFKELGIVSLTEFKVKEMSGSRVVLLLKPCSVD